MRKEGPVPQWLVALWVLQFPFTLPCRALCAYVVHRNVTCILQEGAESYVKAEYRQCGWGPKCPGTVT